MVVVAGLSGSGKSTLARRLAARPGFVHLASGVIRKELVGLAATGRSGAGDEGGIYGAAFSARTYATMYGRAWDHLASRRGVILDATFLHWRIDTEAISGDAARLNRRRRAQAASVIVAWCRAATRPERAECNSARREPERSLA